MSGRPHFPANLADTSVVEVQVVGPHRVRVRHRDGTSATHIFRPGDFGASDFAMLDDPRVFAEAQVIDGCLGWILPNGLTYDIATDGLWAHARGWCPDGSHDLTQQVTDARVELAAPAMVELLPRMRALLAEGWVMAEMTKPLLEGNGGEVRATFTRGGASDSEARIAETPGLAQQLAAANARPSEEFRTQDRGRLER